MALSEKHRSTLYNQLGDTVGDYEAVGELLSNIASRELDEPATRDFVAAQVQDVRTEIESLRTQISESEVRLTRYVHQELNGFRAEMAGFRTEIAGFRSDMNRTNQWMIGLVITLVLGLIASGIESGARLITGGGIPENLPVGYYTQPTLLADVDPNSQIAQEEIFGPVLTVIGYDTDDEAVAIANNSIYGLSGEVTGVDTQRAFCIAQRLRTGNVTVNGRSHFGITSPFGGTRQSGLGRRNGDEGFQLPDVHL